MAALTHHGYGYPPYCCRAFYVQGCDESRSREALCDAALAASGGTSVLELRASSARGHTAMARRARIGAMRFHRTHFLLL